MGIRQNRARLSGPLMKVWKIVKKMLPLVGTLTTLADSVRSYADQGIFGEGVERIESLVGENVTVSQKQDAGAARTVAA